MLSVKAEDGRKFVCSRREGTTKQLYGILIKSDFSCWMLEEGGLIWHIVSSTWSAYRGTNWGPSYALYLKQQGLAEIINPNRLRRARLKGEERSAQSTGSEHRSENKEERPGQVASVSS